MPDEVPAKKVAKKQEEESDDEEAEDEYVVEKIISHSFQKKKTIYLIKWAGYEDESDQTWEPIDNLYATSATRGNLDILTFIAVPEQSTY